MWTLCTHPLRFQRHHHLGHGLGRAGQDDDVRRKRQVFRHQRLQVDVSRRVAVDFYVISEIDGIGKALAVEHQLVQRSARADAQRVVAEHDAELDRAHAALVLELRFEHIQLTYHQRSALHVRRHHQPGQVLVAQRGDARRDCGRSNDYSATRNGDLGGNVECILTGIRSDNRRHPEIFDQVLGGSHQVGRFVAGHHDQRSRVRRRRAGRYAADRVDLFDRERCSLLARNVGRSLRAHRREQRADDDRAIVRVVAGDGEAVLAEQRCAAAFGLDAHAGDHAGILTAVAADAHYSRISAGFVDALLVGGAFADEPSSVTTCAGVAQRRCASGAVFATAACASASRRLLAAVGRVVGAAARVAHRKIIQAHDAVARGCGQREQARQKSRIVER